MLLVCCFVWVFFLATKHTLSHAGAWYMEEVLVVNIQVLVVNVKHSLGFSLSYKINGLQQGIFFCRFI